MPNEKIFVNELNFIPDKIVQKHEIELPISEEKLDKYINEYVCSIESTDTTIFKQLFNGIDLNVGDKIIYKGKVFDVNTVITSDNNYKYIILKDQEQKLSENKQNI